MRDHNICFRGENSELSSSSHVSHVSPAFNAFVRTRQMSSTLGWYGDPTDMRKNSSYFFGKNARFLHTIRLKIFNFSLTNDVVGFEQSGSDI